MDGWWPTVSLLQCAGCQGNQRLKEQSTGKSTLTTWNFCVIKPSRSNKFLLFQTLLNNLSRVCLRQLLNLKITFCTLPLVKIQSLCFKSLFRCGKVRTPRMPYHENKHKKFVQAVVGSDRVPIHPSNCFHCTRRGSKSCCTGWRISMCRLWTCLRWTRELVHGRTRFPLHELFPWHREESCQQQVKESVTLESIAKDLDEMSKRLEWGYRCSEHSWFLLKTMQEDNTAMRKCGCLSKIYLCNGCRARKTTWELPCKQHRMKWNQRALERYF